jgi:hypothetical protein
VLIDGSQIEQLHHNTGSSLLANCRIHYSSLYRGLQTSQAFVGLFVVVVQVGAGAGAGPGPGPGPWS